LKAEIIDVFREECVKSCSDVYQTLLERGFAHQEIGLAFGEILVRLHGDLDQTLARLIERAIRHGMSNGIKGIGAIIQQNLNRHLIVAMLQETFGDVASAARLLDIRRQTLVSRIRALGLQDFVRPRRRLSRKPTKPAVRSENEVSDDRQTGSKLP
jgi:transcriptional regulator of acetoin/glycerol metabolism